MIEHCDKCGASMKKFWHCLTIGMIGALVKARNYVGETDKNEFHLYKDLIGENRLTTEQQMNWTKLRFHALVAKVKEDGLWKKGYWLITKRGGAFLSGNLAIPTRVQTFRNRVVAHSDELTTLSQVFGRSVIFEREFAFEYADEEDLENVLVVKSNKKNKSKLCPECKDKLTTEIITGTGSMPNSMSIQKFLVCANKVGCGYREEISL